ncbi:hypothetical protein AB1E18_014103 [Capra hircus]
MSLRKQTPSNFLKQIIRRPVVVKLNSGVDYRGVLACLDGYMNIALEQTEESAAARIRLHPEDTNRPQGPTRTSECVPTAPAKRRDPSNLPHTTRGERAPPPRLRCGPARSAGRKAGQAARTAGRAPRCIWGSGGTSASRAQHPDVPGPRASQAGGRGLARPAWDLGAAAAASPRSASRAPRGEERGGETPRKLGEFLPLAARPELAPRAGDTSGRLRAPRLQAGGRGQRPPAPPPGARRTRPAPARPPPAPRRRRPRPGPPSPLQPAAPAAPAGGHPGGVGAALAPLALAVRAAPGIESGLGLPDSTVSSAFLPGTQRFPPPSSSNFPFSSSDRSEAAASASSLEGRRREPPAGRSAPGPRPLPALTSPPGACGPGQALLLGKSK